MPYLNRSRSYPRFLRRFGLQNAVWFGDYCRFREVELVANAIAETLPRNVLDVGCAGTLFPFYLAWVLPEARVVGIDSSENLDLAPRELLALAGQQPEASRVRLIPADAREMPFPEHSFDAVSAISVLEHIRDGGDTAAIREMARVVRPGGLIAFSVPLAPEAVEQEADASCPYFIRRYDDKTLEERLINPARPRSVRRRYFGECGLPYSRYYLSLKSAQLKMCHKGWAWKPLRYLGWGALAATPLASRLFLRDWNPACPAPSKYSAGGAVVILKT
jgi:SAM-dependent methyltransferase